MTTRNTDVNLIVRARTEGERAIAGLGNVLETLYNDARHGTSDLAELGKTLGALDRAAGTISGSMTKAGEAIDRQRASLAESNAAYGALLRQQAEAQRVLNGFGEQANNGFVGPRTRAFTEQYAAVKAEVDRLSSSITNLYSKIGTQSAQIDGSRSSLLNLSATSTAVKQAQAEAAAQIELTTGAMQRQAEESRRAAAAQTFYNNKASPSLNRGPATENGAGFEALFANLQRLEGEAARASRAIDPVKTAIRDAERAIKDVHDAARNGIISSDDAIIRERQLRNELDLTIAKIAEGATRAREARKNAVTEYQALINSVTGVTGTRAKDNGATFEALDRREAETERLQRAQRAREAAAIREAAERNSGVTGPRAKDNGATFEALASKAATDAAAQANREAAFAYGQFEAAARRGAAAMREKDAATERDAAAVQHLRDVLNPLVTIQNRFNTELEKYRKLAQDGKISTDELAKAEVHLKEEAERAKRAMEAGANGGRGLFGLRPYELQNLSYQINDVVTGLASGQRFGQVVAQQGGQILQLFPKVGGAVVGALTNPLILAGVATFAALAVAINRSVEEAERLRDIGADLTLSADGGIYDADKLDGSAKALRNYGASIEDATTAVKVFASAGINPDQIDAFARSAQNMADVTGSKVPEAAKKLADSFTGGYEAIAKLDDELNFLSVTQRQSIKDAFEDGNAQTARANAFQILSGKLEEAAQIQRGPATEATRSLRKGYNDLVDSLSNTAPVVALIDLFAKLGDGISRATGNAAAFTTVQARTQRILELQREIASLEQYDRDIDRDTVANPNGIVAARKSELVQLQDQQQREQRAAAQGAADTRARDREAQRKADLRVNDQRERQQTQTDRLLATERGITTEAEKQRRLRVAERSAREQIESSNPNASDAAKNGFVAAALETERLSIRREEAQQAERRKREQEQAARERARLARQTRFVDPVEGRISSGFGARRSPGGVGSTFHGGIDYAVPTGTNVRAPAAGVVIDTGYDAKLGKYVLIDHGNKTQSKFGHLSNNTVVKPGQDVAQGQLIGKSGNTGSATTGAHLHYTVLVNGKPVDPRKGVFVGDGPARFEVDRGEAVQDYEEAEEARKNRQDNFNLSVRQEADERERIIKQLQQQEGLSGAALFAEQRRQEQIEAEANLRKNVENANRNLDPGLAPIVITDEMVARARDLAGTLFDLQRAQDALDDRLEQANRPLDALEEQRDVLIEQRDLMRSIGDFKAASAIDVQISKLGVSIGDAYDKLIEFYRALSPADRVRLRILDDSQLELVIAKLQRAKTAAKDFSGALFGGRVTFRQFVDAFADSATDAFVGFIKNISEGDGVFKSFGRAIREFAATFAAAIGQMIIKAIAFAAALQVLSVITGIPASQLAAGLSAASAGVHHAGGIAGSAGGVKRSVAYDTFQGAMRYHTGGIAGLAPDEVPAILKRGEEVLTEGDPRHRANGGGQGGGIGERMSVRNINLFDYADVAEQMLTTKAGERAVLNIVKKNSRSLKG